MTDMRDRNTQYKKKIRKAHKTCYAYVLLWHPWHRSQASTIRQSRIVHLIFLVSRLPWCRWFLRWGIARNNSIANANAISINTYGNRWPFIVLQRPIDRKIYIYRDRLLYYKLILYNIMYSVIFVIYNPRKTSDPKNKVSIF